MIRKLPFLFALLFMTHSLMWGQDRSPEVDKFLLLQVKNQQLAPSDIAGYQITSEHTSSISGVKHTYFRQTYQGIEIIGAEGSTHTKNGRLLQSHQAFYSKVSERVKIASHTLSEVQAIQSVAQKMGYTTSGLRPQPSSKKQQKGKKIFADKYLSREDIPVKKIYKQLPYGKIVAAYEISIREISGSNWYNFFVDATSGEILDKNNWTSTCGFDHTHNEEEENNAFAKAHTSRLNKVTAVPAMTEGTYNVYAQPLTSPLAGDRTLVSDVFNITASPFGWHDTNGIIGSEFTTTRGNNVNAYEDGDNPGYQPDGGTDLIFDFPFNPVYSTSDQSEDAAITNLFYWNNVIHDVLYLNGMDEASGNFQVNNYGNGGVGDDAVNAEAQDSSGSCNANFQTPPDGFSGTMQMYTCGERDGDVDNHVIIHEYGHGISNRLTGGGNNTDCLFNDEQMGEGWSDWYGNVLTMEIGDQSTDLRPVGNWLFEQDADGLGIRDFPYTTDLAQDPRTYDYIKNTSGPHALGSVWAAMLWEMTWGLIDEHGFDPNIYTGTGGNNRAIALVTEGLKLQPCNPGFVDGRDAILAADVALYDGANQCIIWEAFAKRGLGQSATQGSTFDRTDGSEAFDSPATALTTPQEPFCVTDDEVILAGGLPTGGAYTGPGVTDNGDGITFTFNPSEAGVGTHTISYSVDSECTDGGTDTSEIFVKDENPIIDCQNITITLDEEGNATILPENVVTNFLPGDGYTLDQTGTYDPVLGLGGTQVSLFDDSVASNLPIGFDFTFYQNTYSDFSISSNGFLTFADSGDSGCCSGDVIPGSGGPNNLIAFAWSDLFPGESSIAQFTTIGTAPNRTLVVDIINFSFCCSNDPKVTTQIKLFESTNRIEIHSEGVEGFNMTQGIENADGSDGIAVPGRNSEDFNISQDYVAFVPNAGGFPDNCGNTTTVTLDIDTFTCAEIGDNEVTATATDSEGNSSTCLAIVTVVSEVAVTFDQITETFCADQNPISGLGGGLPLGGVYSGVGVSDDANGETFTFDPSISGVGAQEIIYTADNSCEEIGEAIVTVEIEAAIPEVLCQDITVVLDQNGQVTIEGEDIVQGENTGIVYVVNPFDDQNNILRYDYDTESDILSIDGEYSRSSERNRNYALDRNPVTGQVYLLAGDNQSERFLYEISLDTETEPLFIAEIVSTTGSTNVQSMTFGIDGTLYFVFNGGLVNAYDIESQTISALATVRSFGSSGITYDKGNDRLIYATGNSPVYLSEIDITTGEVSDLFTYVAPNGCSGQAIEYISEDQLIASGTSSCNTLYTVDLQSQEATVLLSPSGSFTSVKDILYVSGDLLDNCNGQPLSFSVSPSTFDCSNIGDNTVIVTATDENGNSSECTATVTVISEFEVTFEPTEEFFCADQAVLSDLGGGVPEGGVYSGPGVTDNGDGLTFTFSPVIVGEGPVDITYTASNVCGLEVGVTTTVQVQPSIPEISCIDTTLFLDDTGQVVLEPEQMVRANSIFGINNLFVVNPFDQDFSIARYDYNAQTDEIILDSEYSIGTGFGRNFAMDFNSVNSLVYVLAATSNSSDRNLYTIDLNSPAGDLSFVTTVISSGGNGNPQDMSFGNDGLLYFIFQGGDVEALDLSTLNFTNVGEVPQGGSVGMTYDSDLNRLLVSTGFGPTILYDVSLVSGEVSQLFSFDAPSSPTCTAQGIEYVGNGKLIASSTASCNAIYTIDLGTQETELLLSSTGSFQNIKDILYLNTPLVDCGGEALTSSLSQSVFTCDDIGTSEVTVTVSDSNGNSRTCTASVTIVDNTIPVLECIANPTVTLDASGNGTLLLEDVVATEIVDNCGEVEVTLSKTSFTCEDFGSTSLTSILVNGSFENGLNNWTSETFNGEASEQDGVCNRPWLVEEDSSNVCCCVTEIFPTDQNFAAYTSFYGSEGVTYELSQSVILPTVDNLEDFSATLKFDWIAHFNMNEGLSRVFSVDILDENGSVITTPFVQELSGNDELAISPQLNVSTALQDYNGEEITVLFRALVSEGFSGSSKSMIDNVALITGSNATQVTVTATDSNGNVSQCEVMVMALDPENACNLSIDNLLPASSVSLHPNPASTSFTVRWESGLDVENLEVFDITGSKVMTLQPRAIASEQVISTRQFSSGIYLVKVISRDAQTLVKRIIIE